MGEATAERLHRLGLSTVRDLATTPRATLQRALGDNQGALLFDLAWGRDPRPVEPVRRERSIGHEQTFAADVDDPEVVQGDRVT